MKNSIKLIAVVFLVSLIPSCWAFPAAKVAKEVADKAICEQYFSETYGLSLEDAARFYCDNNDILDVFLACDGGQECLESAGPKASGMMGLPAK